MVHFSAEQRTFFVTRYLETKNWRNVIAEFGERFPDRNPPTKATIFKNVRKFKQNGTVINLHKERCGRHRTGRSVDNIELVRNALENQNQLTCRRNDVGLPSATFNRIVRLDLHFHPYKMFVRHELKAVDFPRRLRYAEWFLNACNNNRFLFNVVVGDEAVFSMNGKVSSQNVRMYAPKGNPPEHNYDAKNSRQKIHVWGGLCGNGSVLGPFIFHQNVNARTYLDLLNTQVFPALGRVYDVVLRANDANRLWWIQDGAPAHTARIVRRRLTEVFGERVIGLGHTIAWPARSPDLTPCDFFLWGYMKQKVFKTPPENLDDLRGRIEREFENLRRHPEIVRNAIRAMQAKATKCIDKNGHHVEGY